MAVALLLAAALPSSTAGAASSTGAIEGIVTSTDDQPVGDVLVHVSGVDVSDAGFARTAADGTYRTADLEPGRYELTFYSDAGLLGERYDDTGPLGTPTRVPVAAGATTGGIDAQLTPAATISGQVVLPSGVDPTTARVIVSAVSPDAGDGPLAVAAADGSFRLGGLHPGPTYLRTTVLDADVPGTWFDRATTIGDATPIDLVAGSHRKGVTITLEPCAAAGAFPDVTADNRFCQAIAWLVGHEVARGYDDGTFRPTGAITRAALAAFLHRLAGAPAGPFPDPGFTDVPADHPFATAIAWMASSGTAGGYADGTYRPGAEVSRGAFAAFLHRLAGRPESPSGGLSTTSACAYPDVCGSGAIVDAVLWLTQVGVIGGFADGTFRPTDPISRQAMASLLLRDRERAEMAELLPQVAAGSGLAVAGP